jgi:hypothetical protein
VSYADLIERLEKLEGPDQDVDAEIAVRVLGFIKTNRMAKWPGEQPIWEFTDPVRNTTGSWSAMVRGYTASLDAAVALVERVLPGWRIENLCEWDADVLRQRGPWMCDLMRRGKDFADHFPAKCAHAPTPAIALLIATLKALDQQHD